MALLHMGNNAVVILNNELTYTDKYTNINCRDSMIRNIVIGNPFILQRDYESVKNLIDYMTSVGFKNLNLLFDSYPLFLNKDKFEIEEYLNKHQDKSMEDIIDELESNPLLIEE